MRPRRYFAIHYFLLRILGLGWWHHPDEENKINFPGWYLYYAIVSQIVWVLGFIVLETIDPFVGEKDLDRFMFSLSFVITHDLTLLKICIFIFRNAEIQDIVHILEIDLYQFYQNDDKNRKTIRISRIITGSFVFFGWLTLANGNVYGIIQDMRWRSIVKNLNDTTIKPLRTLPQPIFIPWPYQNDKIYIPTFAIENVGLLWTGHIVLTIDTFIASVILHMSSQFEILHEAIVTGYDRTMAQLATGVQDSSSDENDQNDVEENDKIVKRFYNQHQIETALESTLINCFRQHQLLIGCVEKFSRTYSYGFMTQLLSSMAAICVVMVQVSKDVSSFKSVKLITSLAFFFVMIIQLAMQCFTGNELTFQAESISDAVMGSKWERMTPRLRRLLVLMMVRAQRPMRLSAAGYINMDNECFVTIMKAAYSYYAVLRQKDL